MSGTPGCQGARGSGVSPLSLPPAGALVLLSLAYLTSLFYYIPKAALAAVIISAVVPMFDAGIFLTLWRVKSEGFVRERAIHLLRKLPSHPGATPAATLAPFTAPPCPTHTDQFSSPAPPQVSHSRVSDVQIL